MTSKKRGYCMVILDKVIIGLPVVLLGMFFYYKKRINPIVKKINYILKVKNIFIVPQSILTLSFKMKLVKDRIKNISLKANKIKEYIKILHKNKFEITNSILIKQCKYLIYLLEYYDKYCALFLNMEFHMYLEVIKIYIYGKNLINKINIDEFITRLNTSINKIISNFPAAHTMENRDTEDTEDTINKIKKNINIIIGNLIMLQSNIIMENESPINEDYLINNYKIENELKEVFDL
jgi:hypothetical protein